MAKAQPAISAHIPGEAATDRQNRRTGPSGPGSAAAHTETVARAIPTPNQISSGGRVIPDHSSG